MGIFVGTLITDLSIAIEVAPMIFVPFILFSGFTTNSDNIIWPLKIIEYLSPIWYVFEYFVRNEFKDSKEELGPSYPVTTLSFDLGMGNIILIMSGYCVLLMILSIITLKLNSKGLRN